MDHDKKPHTVNVILKNTGNNIITYLVPNCSAERFDSMEKDFKNARKEKGGIVELWSDGDDFGLDAHISLLQLSAQWKVLDCLCCSRGYPFHRSIIPR